MRLGERLMNSSNYFIVSFRPVPTLWSLNSSLPMNWWTPPVRGFAVEADVAPSDLDHATGEPDDPISNHTGEGSPDAPISWSSRCRCSWMSVGYVRRPHLEPQKGKDHRAPLKLDQPVAPLLDVRLLPVVSPARGSADSMRRRDDG